MNRFSYFFIFTFLSTDLLASPFDKIKAGYDKMKGKYDDTKAKIEDAKGKVEEVKGKINEVKGDIKKVAKGIEDKYSEINGDIINGNDKDQDDINLNSDNKIAGQPNNISKEEYVKWAQCLQNLSPAGLRDLVQTRNFYMAKTRELEECIKANRNIKKFVLITDVSIEKK